jgi:hypothetical protein
MFSPRVGHVDHRLRCLPDLARRDKGIAVGIIEAI